MLTGHAMSDVVERIRSALNAKGLDGKAVLSAEARQAFHVCVLMQVVKTRGDQALDAKEKSALSAGLAAAGITPDLPADEASKKMEAHLAKFPLPKAIQGSLQDIIKETQVAKADLSKAAKAFSAFGDQTSAPRQVGTPAKRPNAATDAAMAARLLDNALKGQK